MTNQILTEEEIRAIERDYKLLFQGKNITQRDHGQVEDLISSHRAINERNRMLVQENDVLNSENIARTMYEGFLRSVIRSGETLEDEQDFEWFKQKREELK